MANRINDVSDPGEPGETVVELGFNNLLGDFVHTFLLVVDTTGKDDQGNRITRIFDYHGEQDKYGELILLHGNYYDSSDYRGDQGNPRTVIFRIPGTSAEGLVAKLDDLMDRMAAAGPFDYRLLAQNSNSVPKTLLAALGYNMPHIPGAVIAGDACLLQVGRCR